MAIVIDLKRAFQLRTRIMGGFRHHPGVFDAPREGFGLFVHYVFSRADSHCDGSGIFLGCLPGLDVAETPQGGA